MTKINRVLQISFWSYAFIFVVSCSLQITQVDLWYQLAEGFHILSTWTLPTAPPAAFGLPAAPYFDEYAGYEIVLALLYKLGGFPGLWLVFTAVYLAIIFLPFSTSGRTYPAFQFAPTVALFFAGLLIADTFGTEAGTCGRPFFGAVDGPAQEVAVGKGVLTNIGGALFPFSGLVQYAQQPLSSVSSRWDFGWGARWS